MNKKIIYVVLILLLVGFSFITTGINAGYPPQKNIPKNELYRIHKNLYYDSNKIFGIAVFLTALQNNISFDIAVQMGYNTIKTEW